ncbi:MAG: hypothetical protein NT167_30020, partial [Verrucomicrobia bacterium]|nr:hypothetical protein [Verrucomicrobiota bacterium]
DWFLLGRERLEAADAVRGACGVCNSAVELLQEAIERYLKGYLVATGWPLQRIHNLSTSWMQPCRKTPGSNRSRTFARASQRNSGSSTIRGAIWRMWGPTTMCSGQRRRRWSP